MKNLTKSKHFLDKSNMKMTQSYLPQVVLFFIFILIIIAGFFSWDSWNQTKREHVQQLATVMEMGEKSLGNFLNQTEISLLELSEDVYMGSEKLNSKSIHNALVKYKSRHPEMLNMNLIDYSGQILVSANNPVESKLPNLKDEATFLQSREELLKGANLSIARPFIGKQVKEWVSQLRFAIRDKNGNLKYILAAVLPVNMLETFWKDAPILKHSVIGILRDDAYLLNRYPVPEASTFSDVYGIPRTGTLINYLNENHFPNSGTIEGKNSFDKFSILYSFRRIENRNVTLFIMMPIPYIQSVWMQREKVPALLFILLILTIISTYLYYIKKDKELAHEREEASVQLISNANLAALGIMAGGIAHEIKNPLAGMLLRATVIRDHVKNHTLKEDILLNNVDRIENMGNKIVKIINGLKTISRNSEADPMESIKIGSLVDDALELCQEKLRSHSIQLKVDILYHGTIECRGAQIGQIILNLLGNAADAIENLKDKWVSLLVKQIDDKIQVIITDSGHGIPPEIVEKLMRPFFTTKEVGKGTGLGLSISFGVAKEHNGVLFYDEKSVNTRFVLELPIVQPKNTTIKQAS